MKLNQDFEMAVKTIRLLKRRKRGEYVQTAEIADRLDFAVGYLQKVIHVLGRHGLVDSKRGRIGGVRLQAKTITLLDVWKATIGEGDLNDPPVNVMARPLKSFADAMDKVVLYKGK
ncbi:MAG: Rrf2 family transcriptional regulator [Phycisphaerales bacterium]|nr:MAG: Rrf2 family transcriptional regulator [Phycisphaerales bacterium]